MRYDPPERFLDAGNCGSFKVIKSVYGSID